MWKTMKFIEETTLPIQIIVKNAKDEEDDEGYPEVLLVKQNVNMSENEEKTGEEAQNDCPATAASDSAEGNSTSESTKTITSPKQTASSMGKVDILLKSIGNAPIMKKKKWTVDKNKKIHWVADFIKKYIKSDPSESLFLYVNQCFAPSPDTDIGSVFDCFGSDGRLVLHYSKAQAWG